MTSLSSHCVRQNLRLALGLFAGSIVLSATACDKSKAPAKTEVAAHADSAKPEAAAEGAAKPAEGEAAAAAEETSCTKYADSLCETFGAESPNCQAAKDLFKYVSPKACDAGLTDAAFTKTAYEGARKNCTELAEKLCKDVGEDTDSCKLVKEQTPKFPPERCDGMLASYDQVLAELKKMEEANKPLDDAKQAKIAASTAPSFGPADAKVTIVEFSDFQCPFCTRAATATEEIRKEYGDKVRFVFRQFPLSFHKDAHLASQAALFAHSQGKFWEYHDLVFKNQKALSREDLEKYAKEVGLDLKAFKKALDDGTFKQAVDDDVALGGEVGVSGTPSMFLNGKRVGNATAFEAIKVEIDAALEKANG